MAMQIEACPFCGTRHNHISHHMLAFFVVCQHCNSSGPRRGQIELAIQDWNQLSLSRQHLELDNQKQARIQLLLNQLHLLEQEVQKAVRETDHCQ